MRTLHQVAKAIVLDGFMFESLYIRPGQPEDAQSLATLTARTFYDTFVGTAEPADITAYLQDSCSLEQLQSELAEANNLFFLAFAAAENEGNGDPIGYAKLRKGAAETSVSDRNSIELERLYADKPAIGHGVGSRLMQTCLDEAIAQSYTTAWLGVWENNLRAIAFYQRWGFETVGSHIFTVGTDDQTDLIMQKSLIR